MAQSTSNLLEGTTAQDGQAGSLSGVARLRPDGIVAPVFEDAPVTDGAVFDAIFRPSTPWPLTTGPDAMAYAEAMKYITNSLTDFKSYGDHLRTSYLKRAFLAADTSYGDSLGGVGGLSDLRYPGNGRNCTQEKGTVTNPPGYTWERFCDLITELTQEFRWIDRVRTLFDTYEQALDRSNKASALDLVTVAAKIQEDVKPPSTDLISQFGELLVGIGEVAEAEGNPAGVFTSLFDIGEYIASEGDGTPIPEQISTKADELGAEIAANIAQTEDAMDSIRAVALSDYGRLSRLGPIALAANASVPDLEANIKLGAERYFTSTLMRIAYVPWELKPVSIKNFTLPMPPDKCFVVGDTGPAQTWDRVPESSWIAFRSAPEGQAGDWKTLVLNSGRVLGGYPAPEELTQKMFGPSSGGSAYGIEKSKWFWELGDPFKVQNCNPGD